METTRESKIKRINEVMSDKTLSFWCVIIIKDNDYDLQKCRITWLHYWDYVFNTDIWCVWEVEKCIWHPVMIWDALDWYWRMQAIWEYGVAGNVVMDMKVWRILGIRWYKRKPIEEQSDDCIDYLYSLLPTEDDLKRNYIWCELDNHYVDIANKRIQDRLLEK